MFFTYILVILVLAICLLPTFGSSEIIHSDEDSAYHMGIEGASCLLSILIAILPFVTMSRSGCNFLEKITGLNYWPEYEGGFIVSILVLATSFGLFLCFRGTLDNSEYKAPQLQKSINKRTYRWGFITALIIEALIILSLIISSSIKPKQNKYNYMYQAPLNEESTETYHNKYNGAEQEQYKNSKEQEQDLKDIDEIIKEEEKNGVYDENPY